MNSDVFFDVPFHHLCIIFETNGKENLNINDVKDDEWKVAFVECEYVLRKGKKPMKDELCQNEYANNVEDTNPTSAAEAQRRPSNPD